MARYIGPTCKLARREGADLSLKSPARALDSEVQARAEARPARRQPRARASCPTTPRQLREKQKVKRIYGLLERQFRNYYKKAVDQARATPARTCCSCSKPRLDNVVYRMGFAVTRPRPASWCRTRGVAGQR